MPKKQEQNLSFPDQKEIQSPPANSEEIEIIDYESLEEPLSFEEEKLE